MTLKAQLTIIKKNQHNEHTIKNHSFSNGRSIICF